MALPPGSTLGSYRIIAPLGAGGMGEVYRASDPRLKREVALKVLPDLFARDAERMARFEREAQLLAALNHPNIASIYGLEQTDDRRCLVLELVEGRTLAERIAAAPLPLDETLNYALQIAAALETAHEKGIVHRDLKPANVKVTPEGAVKVLDFGLAKALEDESAASDSPASVSPTLTMAATRAGYIMGTAAYMSPEQAKGKPVDRRADIWAFGVVLFEMLVGSPLFGAETASETLASVMMTPIDWSRLPPSTPPRILRLLRRCLERDSRRRLRDVGEARILLEDHLAGRAEPEADAAAVTTRKAGWSWRGAAPLIMAGLLAGAAMVGPVVWRMRPSAVPPRVVRFEIAVPDQADSGPLEPRIAPDGRAIAYASRGSLWIRDAGKIDPREVKTAGPPEFLAWSPDSAQIVYAAGGTLFKVASSGGESAALSRLTGSFVGGRGISWGPGGRIVFSYGSSGVFEVSDKGGDPRPLVEVDMATEQDLHEPSFLPDGSGVLFVRHSVNMEADTIALVASGKKMVVLRVEGQRLEYPTYASSGHILYHRLGTNPGIWAVPFSLSALKTTGEPFLVAAGGNELSVSTQGTLIYTQRGGTGLQQLVWVDRGGKVLGAVGEPGPEIGGIAIAPDGARAALVLRENDAWDLWVHDFQRATRTKLTFEGLVWAPAWVGSGRRIAYNKGGRALSEMLAKSADGSGEAANLGSGVEPHPTSDEKSLVYALYDHETNFDIWYRPYGGGEPIALVRTPAREEEPVVSPEGAFLAYTSDESGRNQVYLKRFPQGEGKWQVSADTGSWPIWSRKGDEIIYRADESTGPALWAVEIVTRPTLELGRPHRLFSTRPIDVVIGPNRRFDVAPDGQRFLMARTPGGGSASSAITVVQNWYAEFSGRE